MRTLTRQNRRKGRNPLRITAAALAALALCLAAGCTKTTEPVFPQLEGLEWCFSSGVGAWSTDLRILPDGSFSGEYHDSEMGECSGDYPDGTLYLCTFTGRMSLIGQADGSTWRIRVDELKKAPGQEGEQIADGIRTVYTDPYGISEGDEMLLYRPGTPTNVLSDDMKLWAGLYDPDNLPSALETWFLASERNGSGFVGTPAGKE